jgi:hypothetical protein
MKHAKRRQIPRTSCAAAILNCRDPRYEGASYRRLWAPVHAPDHRMTVRAFAADQVTMRVPRSDLR